MFLRTGVWSFRVYALLLLTFLSMFAHADEAKKQIYTFGVVPQQSALVLAKKWLPILSYLNKKTGYKFQFKTTSSIPEFEKNLSKGVYDFAYMNPYHFTVFSQNPGYQALLKQGDKKIRGILVSHQNSNIKTLQDLHKLTLAFPAPAAFAATVIPQAVLKQKSIEFSSKYVSSHESVYKNVAYGNFKAGGGIERTFANLPEEIRKQLKVFWRSEGYTPHAIAVSPVVNIEVHNSFRKAFLSMNDSSEGLMLLESLKFKSVISANNADWDDVRELDINLLENLKVVSGS